METVETTEATEKLTDEEKEWIDRATAQISDRITLERLSERVPAVKRLIDDLEKIVQLSHVAASVFQVYGLTIQINDDGKTNEGLDGEEAKQKVTEALNAVRFIAINYQ